MFKRTVGNVAPDWPALWQLPLHIMELGGQILMDKQALQVLTPPQGTACQRGSTALAARAGPTPGHAPPECAEEVQAGVSSQRTSHHEVSKWNKRPGQVQKSLKGLQRGENVVKVSSRNQ